MSQEGHSPATRVDVATDGAAAGAEGGLTRQCHKKATRMLCVDVLTGGSGVGCNGGVCTSAWT